MRVVFDRFRGRYVVTAFNDVHNHGFVIPEKRKLMRSYRRLLKLTKVADTSARYSGGSDIVEDLVLSSDEESEMEDDSAPMKKGVKGQESAPNQRRKSVKRDVSDKSTPITKKGKKRKRARMASS